MPTGQHGWRWCYRLSDVLRLPVAFRCLGLPPIARGSGKSLLGDAASLIAYGRHAPRKTFSGDDDEQRKAITATAIEALPSVLLDNVDCVLGGSSLDAALTATMWTDRILSTNTTTGELPMRTVFMATGNNLRFGDDSARRVLPMHEAPALSWRAESLASPMRTRHCYPHDTAARSKS